MPNRKTIFRGLPLNGDGKYVYGSLIVCGKDRYIVPDTPIFIDTIFGSLEVDPATVGQYIGIEDNNGVGAYVGNTFKDNFFSPGDLLRFDYNKDMFRYEVVLDKDGSFYMLLDEYVHDGILDIEIIEDEASHE